MKLPSTILLALCVAFVGCSNPTAPSSDQIQAALDNEVKKGNPSATAKLTDIETEKDGKTTKFKFACMNCMLEDGTRTKETVPSATGKVAVWLDPQDGKWKFNNVIVDNEDGTKDTLAFDDHTF